MKLAAIFAAVALSAAAEGLPEGTGLAAKYPGDNGIENDAAVVFAENFEIESLDSLAARWQDISNKDLKVLFLSGDVPPGSAGTRSLEVTATRGENSGGHLFKVLDPGCDRLFLRFYVKFAADYGFNHHFVSLGGAVNPPPYPLGGAGLRPENSFTTGIEPAASSATHYPWTGYDPPGIWHFYTYWPEMRSWENMDGTGTSFYGNNFEPAEPVVVPRDRWVCVEIMVKMNSSPEETDGEQALWIDGKLAMHYGPGTMVGRWVRDSFFLDGDEPFEGFRWRRDMLVNVNKLWLLHYVSEDAFSRTEAYARSHPEFPVNTDRATVWFDDIVAATEYIGPIWDGSEEQ